MPLCVWRPHATDFYKYLNVCSVAGKAQSEEARYEDWDAVEEEARAVTEYLYGTRSRAAARALLAHRYHEQADPVAGQLPQPQAQPQPFNVYLVRKSRTGRQRPLQRGVTTPTSTTFSPESNPCNPNTCDFWPHCAHRDSLYPPSSKSSTPSPSSSTKLPPSSSSASGSMRLSQSYPATTTTTAHRNNRNNGTRRLHEGVEEKTRKTVNGAGGQSTRSSPASLERVDVYDALTRKIQSVLNGVAEKSLPEVDEKKHYKWKNGEQHLIQSQIPRRTTAERAPKVPDAPSPSAPEQHHVHKTHRNPLAGTNLSLDLDERRVSPVTFATSRSPSAKGGSSSSSSSSDVWVTTSDRTVTKSPRTHKSSGASTPMDVSSGRLTERETPVSRPGSAPAQPEDDNREHRTLDAQQRSLSLPKSFLSERYGFKVSKHR